MCSLVGSVAARIHGFIQIHGVKVGNCVAIDTKIMILTKTYQGLYYHEKNTWMIYIYIHMFFCFLNC